LEQMELQLQHLEVAATEDELTAVRLRTGLRRYNRSSARDRRVSRSPSNCRASAP
jgi:hypothetical protein